MMNVVRPFTSRWSAVKSASSVWASSAEVGFVEDEDRRVLQERPSDGEPLFLAAGEVDAALGDECRSPPAVPG